VVDVGDDGDVAKFHRSSGISVGAMGAWRSKTAAISAGNASRNTTWPAFAPQHSHRERKSNDEFVTHCMDNEH
jgi:hypothetical protein